MTWANSSAKTPPYRKDHGYSERHGAGKGLGVEPGGMETHPGEEAVRLTGLSLRQARRLLAAYRKVCDATLADRSPCHIDIDQSRHSRGYHLILATLSVT